VVMDVYTRRIIGFGVGGSPFGRHPGLPEVQSCDRTAASTQARFVGP
jgi:hypothetical protein